jgi:hypothetical protein
MIIKGVYCISLEFSILIFRPNLKLESYEPIFGFRGFFINFMMAKQLEKFPEELTKLVKIALEKTKSSKILPMVLPPKKNNNC